MGTQAEQAKQLDSVTDRVQEVELDAGKAQEAMTALSSTNKDEDSKAAALAAITVAKEVEIYSRPGKCYQSHRACKKVSQDH